MLYNNSTAVEPNNVLVSYHSGCVSTELSAHCPLPLLPLRCHCFTSALTRIPLYLTFSLSFNCCRLSPLRSHRRCPLAALSC